jgi:hypothetical protein
VGALFVLYQEFLIGCQAWLLEASLMLVVLLAR